MPKYIITPKAGRFVAGRINPGVGTVLDLPPHAAEYELSLGTLRAVDTATVAPQRETAAKEAAPVEADEKPADKKKR